MRILYYQPCNFNTHTDEISIDAWDPSMEHDVFCYSDKEDAEVYKEQFCEHTLRRVEMPRRRVRC